MKFGFKKLSIVAATALLLSSVYAQDLPSAEMAKLSKPQILTIAQSGKAQELTVEIEAKAISDEFASKRSSIMAKVEARKKAKTDAETIGINNDIAYNNNVAVSNFVAQLAARKSSVISPLASLGVTVVQDYSQSGIILVKVPNAAALEALLKNPIVLKVYATEPIKLSANWPSSFSDLTVMNSPPVNKLGYTGQNQMVGILDTGFDENMVSTIGGTNRFYDIGTSVPDNNHTGPCVTGGRPNTAPVSLGCPNGNWQHGTLNAQIIAAVAPSAYLAYQQIVDEAGGSNTTYLQNGLNNLIALKNQEPSNQAQGFTPTLVAVNLSINVPGQIYSGAASCGSFQGSSQIQTLLNDGVVVVAASGNDGSTAGVTAPACYPGVLSVGATYDSTTTYAGCGTGNHYVDTVACFSNRNAVYPSVYAPGVNIGDSNTYVNGAPQSGTSMAAPHVAGEVAILRQVPAGASKSVAALVSTIVSSGTSITDGTGSNKNRVDVSKAIASLSGSSVYGVVLESVGLPNLEVGTSYTVAFHCIASNRSKVACPSNSTYVWTSSNPAAATVYYNTITAVSPGATTVSVYVSNLQNPTASMPVQVTPPTLTTMTISPNPLVNGVAMTYTLVVSGLDQNGQAMAAPSVTWTSANPAIATVNSAGLVTGVSVGTTTVTATSGNVTANVSVQINSGKSGTNPPPCGRACSGVKPVQPAAKNN